MTPLGTLTDCADYLRGRFSAIEAISIILKPDPKIQINVPERREFFLRAESRRCPSYIRLFFVNRFEIVIFFRSGKAKIIQTA